MVKGYKVFNPDWTCQGFKYEVGKTYELTGELRICSNGFHFCKRASDCFNYYPFDSKNKVAEVIARGNIMEDGNKCCTNKVEIVREIPWQELLTIVNEGLNNTGLRNTGNRNTGDGNAGNWNTGDRNTGECNTGDWNATNYSCGVFCTEPQKILIFDKPSDWTLKDWRNSEAYYLLSQIQTVFWVNSSDMTPEEKELHPEHETTGGFLKTVHLTEAAEKWWSELSDREKQVIRDIPNFDADKFYKITGIRA
jgi:hypothetical protein